MNKLWYARAARNPSAVLAARMFLDDTRGVQGLAFGVYGLGFSVFWV